MSKAQVISLFVIFSTLVQHDTLHANGDEQKILQKLENCLMQTYGVDCQAMRVITSKFSPLTNNRSYHGLITEFIDKSKMLLSRKNDTSYLRGADDAVFKAPKWHEVLYENSRLRVLWTVIEPGERVSLHKHYWRKLLVILQGARFHIDYADGRKENNDWRIGVYELPPDLQAASYSNIDKKTFLALTFEIKD